MRTGLTVLQQELDAALDRFQRTLSARFPHPLDQPTILEPVVRVAAASILGEDGSKDATTPTRMPQTTPAPDAPVAPPAAHPIQNTTHPPLDKANQRQHTKSRMLHLAMKPLDYVQRIFSSIKRWLS